MDFLFLKRLRNRVTGIRQTTHVLFAMAIFIVFACFASVKADGSNSGDSLKELIQCGSSNQRQVALWYSQLAR